MDYLLFDEHNVLELLDEYSLYCHYLGYKPLLRMPYRSPVRAGNQALPDNRASFSIFERTKKSSLSNTYHNDYVWKDSGTGITMNCGDIFHLVQLLYGLNSKKEAILKICDDFNLTGHSSTAQSLVQHIPEPAAAHKIRIQSRPFQDKELKYSSQYCITEDILKYFDTTAFEYYYLSEFQQAPSSTRHDGPVYAYRIFNRYQLYFPYREKSRKFRMDYNELCVPGWKQLRRDGRPLIIQKAMKDVQCSYALGYDALSPRSENTPLPIECIQAIQQGLQKGHWSCVFTLFDNDGKHSAHKYPFTERHVPEESGEKDTTDFCARYGRSPTIQMINHLIYG